MRNRDRAAGAAQLEMERPLELTAAQLRRLMISEFRDWLGTGTNRNGRPFQPDTISAYADAAIALDAWMSAEGIEADFTGCDTRALNRFFAAYYRRAWAGRDQHQAAEPAAPVQLAGT